MKRCYLMWNKIITTQLVGLRIRKENTSGEISSSLELSLCWSKYLNIYPSIKVILWKLHCLCRSVLVPLKLIKSSGKVSIEWCQDSKAGWHLKAMCRSESILFSKVSPIGGHEQDGYFHQWLKFICAAKPLSKFVMIPILGVGGPHTEQDSKGLWNLWICGWDFVLQWSRHAPCSVRCKKMW